jgi:hypothetical protein
MRNKGLDIFYCTDRLLSTFPVTMKEDHSTSVSGVCILMNAITVEGCFAFCRCCRCGN